MEQDKIRIASEYYVAIRANECGKWADASTISSWRETCHDKAMADNKATGPMWANANPVVEYRRVKLELLD